MKVLKVLLFVLFLSGTHGLSAQKLPSSCSVHDTIEQVLKGWAGLAVDEHIRTNLLPEKDSFWLPSDMIERVLNAQKAIYNCDSVNGWGDIYSDTARAWKFTSKYMIGAPGPEVRNGVYPKAMVIFDTSSVYFKSLFKDSTFSGDPYFDSLVTRYNLKVLLLPYFEGHLISTTGFYNKERITDSILSVSWILDVKDAPVISNGNCTRAPASLTYYEEADTLYLRYSECNFRHWSNYKYWNYKIYPDCSVEYLGDSQFLIQNPVEKELLDTAYYSCKDSLTIYLDRTLLDSIYPGYTLLWKDSSTADSFVVQESGNYWVKLLSDSAHKPSFYGTTKAVFLETAKLGFNNDTLVCGQDKLKVAVINPTGLRFTILTPIWWQNGLNNSPASLKDSGVYRLYASYCGIVDSINVQRISKPQINGADTQLLCENTALDLSSEKAEHYSWSTGDMDSFTTIDSTGFYICQTQINRCVFLDTVWVEQVNQTKILGTDTQYFCLNENITIASDSADSYHWSTGDSTQSAQFDQPGIYYCDTKIHGCSFTDSVYLGYFSLPIYSLGKDTNLTYKDTIFFNVPNHFTNLYWNDGDSAYSKFFVLDIWGKSSYDFWVEMIDSNGCWRREAIKVFNKPKGIKNASIKYVNFYPNPFKNSISLSAEFEDWDYYVHNAQGSVIYSGSVQSGRIDDLANYGPGVYIFKLTKGQQVVYFRAIKD